MYRKIERTAYAPKKKPLLIWDGNCSFCAYWVARWEMMTGDNIDYEPYQTAHNRIEDIRLRRFQEAARLIEPDGTVYNGAEAVYRSLTYGKGWGWLYTFYEMSGSFRALSDQGYQWIANNRSQGYRITKLLFGSNPYNRQHNWLLILIAAAVATTLLVVASRGDGQASLAKDADLDLETGVEGPGVVFAGDLTGDAPNF